MVEHHLREGLAGSSSAEIGIEAEGFHDREVGLDIEHWSPNTLFFGEHLSTTLVQGAVDATDGVLGALDLDEEDGFLESGVGEEAGGVGDATAHGNDLSTTTVDGIGV